MLRRAAAVSLLLFASTLHAQLFFGTERLICNPRFQGPAAFSVSAATNGTDTLVVVQPGGIPGSLYLQRLGAGAEVLTPHGVPIARDVYNLGGIASNHDGYLVFWTNDDTAWTLAISASGEVSRPRLVAERKNLVVAPLIASNGTDYLATWTEWEWGTSTLQAMALRLGRDGSAIGDPFPLVGKPGNSAGLASDGRDYLAAVERFDGGSAKTTVVSITAAGAVGLSAELPIFLRELAYTKDGYIGLRDENGTTAVAVDSNGHLGAPAIISSDTFMSASSNGADVMSVGVTSHRPSGATRIRRNGDAIETIEHIPLMTAPFSFVATATTHTGDYFTMSLGAPIGVALVSAPPVPEHPLLTFAAPQQAPAIATDGDLHVVAWREATLVRAARLRGNTTLDPAGLDVGDSAAAHALAVNAGRALIAWTEQGYAGGEAPILVPARLVTRILAADGTLSAPVTIAGITPYETPLSLGGAVATSAGFAVLFGQNDSWRVASVDANGKVLGVRSLDLPAGVHPSLARRADGFLLIYTELATNDITAVPYHADGRPAGPPQLIAGTTDHEDFPDVAGDGNGHFLAIWNENNDLMARPLDENGVPSGPGHYVGWGYMHVGWSGSSFVIVGREGIRPITLDGRALPSQFWLPPYPRTAVIAGDTIALLHSGIDAGVGDVDLVFVRRFTTPRHHATRP
jgi:hypothetical protein